MNDFKTYEETVAEVLGRYSVSDLVEQLDADLERADRLFYDSEVPVEVVDRGEVGPINFWKIKSGEKQYEVRRFKNFVWCSCKDFFFRKRCCKHCAITASVFCSNCRQLRATKDKLCVPCYSDRSRFLGTNRQEKTNEPSIAKI